MEKKDGMMIISGMYTPLITPFKDNQVDAEALRFQIKRQESAQVAGLVVLGTTGEAHSLSSREKECVLAIARESSLPLIVGGTEAVKEADALLVAPPAYIRPTQEGLYRFFSKVAASCDLPIILYNIPSRACCNIEVKTIEQLAKIDNVVAIKECNYQQAGSRVLPLLCGDDQSLLSMMALGAVGAIASTANIVPKQMVELVSYCLANDFEKARELYYKLLPLFYAAGCETNPIPCKAMMNLLGLRAGEPRFPLTPCSKQDELRELLWKLGYLANREELHKPIACC